MMVAKSKSITKRPKERTIESDRSEPQGRKGPTTGDKDKDTILDNRPYSSTSYREQLNKNKYEVQNKD